MTVDELLELARARGWGHKVHVVGRSGAGLADNVYVVGWDAEGWFVAFHERGETEMMSRQADEDAAADAVWQLLRQDHAPRQGSPGSPAGYLTGPPGKEWSTWTLGRLG